MNKGKISCVCLTVFPWFFSIGMVDGKKIRTTKRAQTFMAKLVHFELTVGAGVVVTILTLVWSYVW